MIYFTEVELKMMMFNVIEITDISILVIINENIELFFSYTWSLTSRFGVLCILKYFSAHRG